jgi:hypothetical protein
MLQHNNFHEGNTPITETPRPPAGLKSRGRGLWKEVLTSYELDAGELQLLRELCRAVDQIDALDAEIAASGLLITGSPRPGR